jgi:nucleotide-binding universal stress UspA family protein
MTIVVGYLAGKSGTAALELAAGAARSSRTSLTVAAIVPRPWATPSSARIDAHYATWSDQLAAESAQEAKRFLATLPDGLSVSYRSHADRSASKGLIELVQDLNADMLVLGSSANGQPDRVVLGSTADRLLHSSPVPVAIAPRGYHGARTGQFTRVTCAYPGTPETVHVVERTAELAEQLKVPLRVVTFAVRGRTMYPPEVGLHAEDSILKAWEERAREPLAQLRADGVVGHDAVLQVVGGNSWDQALDAADWQEGEILALGTSPRGDVKRVFLGSRGTKIMRHSPVPVLVLPG